MLVVLKNLRKMYLKKIFLAIIFCTSFKPFIWACHKGGPMGFASNDPGGFSLDITLSPTYTGASTIGTLDCKNWDYSKYEKNKFLISQWSFLNEDIAKGKGKNLVALSQMVGCEEKNLRNFSSLLHENYSSLFGNSESPDNFFKKLEILLSQNPSYYCSG